jgi:amidohydrolase
LVSIENSSELKELACTRIDQAREKILAWSSQLYATPELGFQEYNTTGIFSGALEELGITVERGIALTGCRARLNPEKEGPRLALLAELDALSVPDHPDSKPFIEGSAVHACGHSFQMAGMLATAVALSDDRILGALYGGIDIIATPAEEYIDFAFRNKLRQEGKIQYLSGKQEMIRLGVFDDIDLAMMFHSMDLGSALAMVGVQSNGFIAKQIQFIGKPSHAGASPEQGVNALNAASLALMNIHAQRETFRDSDHVRVHPIITKGGDVVNVIPSDVRMDAYVRARTLPAMKDANMKVNRALRAGGAAVGAEVNITDCAGYLPILNYPDFYDVFENNVGLTGFSGKVIHGGDFSGSFDFGDLSYLIPAIHPMIGGISGALHDAAFHLVDFDRAVLLPAKAMAMSVIDLLSDNALKAKGIVNANPPALSKAEYLQYLDSFSV